MFNETSFLGNEADGCPPGMYRRSGRNDPRDACITDPNYHIGPIQTLDPCPRTPSEIIDLGPCATGFRRNPCSGVCESDPNFQALPGTSGEYVNVNGTLVKKSLFQSPFADQGPVASGGLSGIDSTTLLLLGGLMLFVFLKKK